MVLLTLCEPVTVVLLDALWARHGGLADALWARHGGLADVLWGPSRWSC